MTMPFGLSSAQWGYVALWLGIGVVAGLWMGLRRGRPLRGVLLGAPLGPAALLLLRWLPTHLLDCPVCSRPIHRDAKRCRHCGANLLEDARLTVRQRLRQQSQR
jgi:predicted nucleic acid-binding Zn ribbon protein